MGKKGELFLIILALIVILLYVRVVWVRNPILRHDVAVERPVNCKEIISLENKEGMYVHYIDTDGNHRLRQFNKDGSLNETSYIMKASTE